MIHEFEYTSRDGRNKLQRFKIESLDISRQCRLLILMEICYPMEQ